MSITQHPASPSDFSKGRFGHQLNLIVIHTEDGFQAGTDNWFANPSSHVSAHYNIGLNGAIDQCVSDGDTAWHTGNWEFNCRSIGIEFEDNRNPQEVARTDAQYHSGAQLIADKCRQYSMPCDRAHIIGHREVPGNDHPACPGNENIDKLVSEANAILSAPVATPTVAPPKNPHGNVKVTAQPWLNLRQGPGSGFPLATGYDGNGNPITHLPYGAVVPYVNVVTGEPVNGNPYWLVSIRGHYFAAYWTTYGRARLLARVGDLLTKKK